MTVTDLYSKYHACLSYHLAGQYETVTLTCFTLSGLKDLQILVNVRIYRSLLEQGKTLFSLRRKGNICIK